MRHAAAALCGDGRENEGDEEGRYFLESRKYQRTCVVNGKAAGFKLGVALATCRPAPVAGESLNRPDESKLSSVRFLLSPLGWRSQTIGEIFKGTDGACADPGPRIFPATGHKTAVPPSSLIQLTFTSHTGSLVLS